MARSQSSKILTVILVIAVLIGIGAVAFTLLNSPDDEGDNDTQPTVINRCTQIVLYNNVDNTQIEPGAKLDPNTEIKIEAHFENSTTDTNVFETFQFNINSEDNSQDVNGSEVVPEKSGDLNVYKPSITFSEFADVTSISITAEAIDVDALGDRGPACTAIYEVDQTIAIDPGDGGDSDGGGDQCIAAGSKGKPSLDNVCCAGLAQVKCSEASASDATQCTTDEEDCFVCINSATDSICGPGENTCNSAGDCADGQAPPSPNPDSGGEGKTPQASILKVTNTGPQCVTRISPENTGVFTTTITNSSSEAIQFDKVSSSIPLGFTYVTGSAVLGGSSDNDASLQIETVGSSQQLTWESETGWSVPANGTFTVTFNATADSQALTGTNTFSTVITPLDPEANPDDLRADYTFTVAQSCSTPKTGLFDETESRILLGLGLILAAGFFYSNATTDPIKRFSFKLPIIGSSLYQHNLKKNNPREYFEKRFEKGKR